MSNNLDPDQDRHVGPDLNPNCLLRSIIAEDKSPLARLELKKRLPNCMDSDNKAEIYS